MFYYYTYLETMTEYCIFKITQNKCKTLPVMSHKLFYNLNTRGIHIAHTKSPNASNDQLF